MSRVGPCSVSLIERCFGPLQLLMFRFASIVDVPVRRMVCFALIIDVRVPFMFWLFPIYEVPVRLLLVLFRFTAIIDVPICCNL